MRIIAGIWRGRRLMEVGKGDARAALRPTSDRVREAVFSILTATDSLADTRVLDLFAGTGALGLEALSRGAKETVFVENGRVSLDILSKNIAELGANAGIERHDATKLPPNAGAPFNLVFLDPPYGTGMGERALSRITTGQWVAPGAVVVWEDAEAKSAPPGFQIRDQRKYGTTWITVLTYAP